MRQSDFSSSVDYSFKAEQYNSRNMMTVQVNFNQSDLEAIDNYFQTYLPHRYINFLGRHKITIINKKYVCFYSLHDSSGDFFNIPVYC